ncbi:MAG TPA: protocatechuate 3,4-dioxygenase subunit alpha, partial [Actinomycetes bacterium]|nr:protocatechuate 3,4-dioxygenase subunit alpha [Actinomycetes bacterium]
MTLELTPSQTVGPYLHIGLLWPDGPYAAPEGTPGAIWLRGRLLDGHGDPVPDGLIETWQADPDGRFDHPDDPRGRASGDFGAFRGFGRCGTDDEGRWAICTMRPG